MYFNFKYDFQEKNLGLLNLRGKDIDFNPVFKSYLLLNFENPTKFHGSLFIDGKKIGPEVEKYLAANNIKIKPYEKIALSLEQIQLNNLKEQLDSQFEEVGDRIVSKNNAVEHINKKILIDKSTCNYYLSQKLKQDQIWDEKSPIKKLNVLFIFLIILVIC